MRYEAAMEMIIRANKNTFRKEDTDVCKALEEPFEDRFQEREQKARAEGVWSFWRTMEKSRSGSGRRFSDRRIRLC